MSKKWIWILAFFMGFAMVGLIVVQTYWIKNAYDVKEKQFDQLIRKSLSEVSWELQRQETYNYLMNNGTEDFLDSLLSGIPGNYSYDTVIKYRSEDNNIPVSVTQNFSYSRNEWGQSFSTGISVTGNDTSSSESANNSRTELPYRFKEKPPENDTGNDNEIQQKLYDRRQYMYRMWSKMLQIPTEIENRVKPAQMQKVIKSELAENGIDLNFEYAVTKAYNIVAYHSKNFNAKSDNPYYQVQLFPDDIFSNHNYLALYFPYRRNFIMKSLGIMGFSSVLLTLVIVLTFTLTIFIIFRQKKLSEIKNDFVNNMTHELKTPISTISLASQMLGDSSIPDASKNLRHISGVITQESKRLGYQVEKVLQMAIFDKGKLNLKLKKINIHELIESVINNFSIPIKAKDGLIIPSLHAENTMVEVDVVHFTNVLSNLIDNAIKYCESKPEIFIETEDAGNELCIAVKDNGIGISKEDQKRIFEKFYRVSTGNLHNVKGFGLGLSYVKLIVEEHKGFIKLESELHQGTTFRIYLPRIK